MRGYGQAPEFAGYGEPEPVGYYAEQPNIAYAEEMPIGAAPEMVGWGEPPFEGYVREAGSRFNAGCPRPTNVGEPPDLAGYKSPDTVNATVSTFTPQPGATPGVPESFKPIW